MSFAVGNFSSRLADLGGHRLERARHIYFNKKTANALITLLAIIGVLYIGGKTLLRTYLALDNASQTTKASANSAKAFPQNAPTDIAANEVPQWGTLRPAFRAYKVTIENDSSIKLDGKTARLYAFNVLPRSRICSYSNGERWACGQRAYIALLNVIGSAGTIDCQQKNVGTPADVDTARTFICRLAATDIAALLLGEGWGVLDSSVTEAQYIDAAAAARRFKTGMWTLLPLKATL